MGIGAVMSIEVVYCDSCGRKVALDYLGEADRPIWHLGKNGEVDADTNDWVCCCGFVVEFEVKDVSRVIGLANYRDRKR
jgi:hypothetical protein